LIAMKYSHLALVVTVLLAAYGPVNEDGLTFLQEDCAGCGALTAGVRTWGLAAQRRDAPQLNYFSISEPKSSTIFTYANHMPNVEPN